MNMVVLVFMACALSNPNACEEKRLTFEYTGETLRSCIMQAQPYLAQWAGEHPNLRVAKWHCAWPNSGAAHRA